MSENVAESEKDIKNVSSLDRLAGIESIATLARCKIIAPQPWDSGKDIRKPGKPCVKCGVWTFMGNSENVPANAREICNGNRYLRYCSEEHSNV